MRNEKNKIKPITLEYHIFYLFIYFLIDNSSESKRFSKCCDTYNDSIKNTNISGQLITLRMYTQ